MDLMARSTTSPGKVQMIFMVSRLTAITHRNGRTRPAQSIQCVDERLHYFPEWPQSIK